MLKFRSYVLVGFASIGLAAAGATSGLAGPLELNPSAPNGPLPTLDTTCTGSCITTNYPFFTTNSNTAFTSFLEVNGTPGSAGTQTVSETGSVLITTFNVLSPAGGTSNVTTNYNVYATFTLSGTGTWTANQFNVNGPVSATVTLWGSPNNNTTSGLNFTTPTLGGFGVTQGPTDFTLGTAQLIAATSVPTASGSCLGAGPCTDSTLATTSFNGLFNFAPAPNTFGPTGFLVNISGPFQLSIGAVQGGAPQGTTETVTAGGKTDFVVAVTGGTCSGTGFNGNCPGGGGQFTYAVAVPEPASLALLGGGLIAFGFFGGLRRRRNQKLSA